MLEEAGTPRSMSTIESWSSGRRSAPAWVILVIARELDLDTGELLTELGERRLRKKGMTMRQEDDEDADQRTT